MEQDMKKLILTTVFAFLAAAMAFGQAKPRLAILPFTGGSPEDAETIAEFFSFEEEINRVFTPVPRTRAIETLMKEQEFQRSGLTDSDTIAEFGKQLNADYVLAGHIAILGDSKLLLITIINVSELRQIAGDYREYQRIESVIDMMPDMAKRIGGAATRHVSGLPGLAVLPFNVLSSGVNQQDAEILAQLLATELANSGRYAVYPRTKAIEKVMEEHNIERGGMTDAESIKAIGEAVNAQYVLSANVRRLGEDNYFSASILHIVEASQGKGTREKYQTVTDGLVLMPRIARTLADAEPERPAEPGQREVNTANAADTARKDEQQRVGERFFGAGANLGLGFGNDAGLGFNILGNVNATVPLVWRLFADAGADIGFSGSIGGTGTYQNPRYRAYRLYARLNIGIPVAVSLFNLELLLLPYAGTGYGYTQATYEFEFEEYGTEETGTKTQKYTGVDLAFGVILTERHHGIRAGVNLNSVSNRAFSETQLILGYMFRF
jgi:TolB-like protein